MTALVNIITPTFSFAKMIQMQDTGVPPHDGAAGSASFRLATLGAVSIRSAEEGKPAVYPANGGGRLTQKT